MSARYEMRFTGSGGQGIILASVILAEAAVVAGKNAVQSQAYGPEARGGMCKAEAVIGDEQIWFGKVIKPDFLLALTQASIDNFSKDVKEDAIIMIDDSLSLPEGLNPERVLKLPILQTATEKVGKSMTANIVAVGAINTVLGLFDQESLHEAVKRHIPAGTEKLNWKALEEGIKLITSAQLEKFHCAMG